MQQQDPFAVIAQDVPQFAAAVAVDLVRRHYGLDVSVSPLISERDQNFRLQTASGRDYVLKIANAAETPLVTNFQIEALRHIADVIHREALPIRTPEILYTLDGATHLTLDSDQGRHVVRVVTFLPGRPLATRSASPALATDMGRYLAWLGRALAGFSHAGSRQSLLWDVQQAPQVARLVKHIPEPAVALAVSRALDAFERHAVPSLSSLREQIIHNDFNPDNVLIAGGDSNRVAGVIDFGDMLQAPLVVDAAIGASYQRTRDGDPLDLICNFLRGYHAVTPLAAEESAILFDLIQARLSASIAILDWRASMRGDDDPYLEKSVRGEASAKRFLVRLQEMPRAAARAALAAACGG